MFIEDRDIPVTAGIYRIGSSTNRSCYIGCAKNIRNRIRGHYKELRNDRHRSQGMQEAFDTGKRLKIIILEVLESPKRFELVQAEQKWFDAIKPKWNNVLYANAPMQDPEVARRQARS